MRHRFFSNFCLLSILLMSNAGFTDVDFESAPQTQLLELYTSQGCSSCPPADAWLNKRVHDPQLWKTLVPVAFHVDYWDWIGWQDPFASDAHSQRQRDYKHNGHINAVYTPGFVIDGQEWRGWFKRAPLPEPIPKQGKLSASIKDKKLNVNFTGSPKTKSDSSLTLHIALLGFGLQTNVPRGENADKTLSENFVVLNYQQVSSQTAAWSLSLPDATQRIKADRYGIALWVTQSSQMKPLQVLGGWL